MTKKKSRQQARSIQLYDTAGRVEISYGKSIGARPAANAINIRDVLTGYDPVDHALASFVNTPTGAAKKSHPEDQDVVIYCGSYSPPNTKRKTTRARSRRA